MRYALADHMRFCSPTSEFLIVELPRRESDTNRASAFSDLDTSRIRHARLELCRPVAAQSSLAGREGSPNDEHALAHPTVC